LPALYPGRRISFGDPKAGDALTTTYHYRSCGIVAAGVGVRSRSGGRKHGPASTQPTPLPAHWASAEDFPQRLQTWATRPRRPAPWPVCTQGESRVRASTKGRLSDHVW